MATQRGGGGGGGGGGGLGIIPGFTALEGRLTALGSRPAQSLHVQNSAMSHTATVILALLLPGEQEQSLHVSSSRNKQDQDTAGVVKYMEYADTNHVPAKCSVCSSCHALVHS